jgi:catechol 2,3-dioxygenase-like lactoylglutathione lyase family enzyme
MNNSLVAIAIDCADAPAVTRFWADVLGRQVAEDSTSQHVILLPGDGTTGGATHHVQQGSGAEDRQEPRAPRSHQ